MQILDKIEAFKQLCKSMSKWGMYIYACEHLVPAEDYIAELKKAAPYLDFMKHGKVMMDGCGIILFDSEEELNALYYQTVGDDGPTNHNPYDGPMKVYALTCSPDGLLMNENT